MALLRCRPGNQPQIKLESKQGVEPMRTEKLRIGPVGADRQAPPPRLTAIFVRWRERARERDVLAQLDEQARRDLGVSEADVWRETHKAPWEA